MRGTKPPPAKGIGGDDLRAQDIRAVPGTFGDPLQAIAALPGVAATASGLPYFYVRGAPPANTGYFLDGIPLPALYHVGPGPSYVPQALLDHIGFFPGAAPARFGRYAGGIIAATLAEPSREPRAEGSLRLFDASAMVESPIDGSSTALVAGRFGYPSPLVSLVAPSLTLGYGDYTARVVRKISSSDTISLLVIGGYDHIEDTSGDLPSIDLQFHRIDLRYDRRWADGAIRVAGTFGYDQTSRPLSTGIPADHEIVRATSGRLRFELEQRLGDTSRLSLGADANTTLDADEFTGENPTKSPLDAEQVLGAYVDLATRLSRRIELSPGVRIDAYRSAGGWATSVEPRLVARAAITHGVRWISTLGIARQPPSYVIPVPGLRIDPAGGLQSTYQVSEGAEAALPLELRAAATFFFSSNRNTSDYVSECGSFAVSCSFVERVSGRTYGLEVLVQRPFTNRLAGWVAYTLSRAERWIGTRPYLSPFDRTHVVSGVVEYDFGAGVRAGARGTVYSGRPDFPSLYFPGQPVTFGFGPGQLAQRRLPPFYRIDVRAEKRWSLGARAWIAGVFDFFNVTLTKEAVAFRCDVLSGTCAARQVGPIALPSIGVEGGF